MAEEYGTSTSQGKSRGRSGGFRTISNRLFFKHLPRNRRYTAIEALLSINRDCYQRGSPLSERDYSRIWKRSRNWVRARLAEFWKSAEVDQLGYQKGDQEGDQKGDHVSAANPRGSGQSGDHTGDQQGDQFGDQRGTTTKRGDRNERREERGNGAAAPLSALSLVDDEEELLVVVRRERPEWSGEQARIWLDNNLHRIEDSAGASSRTPRDPQTRRAAVREKVASWAHHERHAPIPPSAPPPPVRCTTSGDLPPEDQERHRIIKTLKEQKGRDPEFPEIIQALREEGRGEIADDLEATHELRKRLRRPTNAEREKVRP